MKDDTENLKKALLKKSGKDVIPARRMLSMGSTILNLACSGRSVGAIAKGTFVHIVGDSNSGKTFLCLNTLAEAAINDRFDKYRFIVDDPENGSLMNVAKLFGEAVAERIEPPAGTKEKPVHSEVVEEFYDYVEDAEKQETPFIYILDSMDAISSAGEGEDINKERKARETNKEAAGTYGTSRAKVNSSRLRRVVGKLRATGSILIILSQTRDNIGFGAKFNPKVYAGGKALKFFCHLQLWTSLRQDITKTIKGKDRQLGIISKIKVDKSRLTGRERIVEIPIYHSFGIDDTGSCIDYLVEEGYWKESKKVIKAPDFDFVGKKEQLIQKIESEGDESMLHMLVNNTWNEIERACAIKRKSRYV